MNAAVEAERSIAWMRTAGVAIALAVVGLLSLGSAWCGRQGSETPRPLLLETTERQTASPTPAPPVKP